MSLDLGYAARRALGVSDPLPLDHPAIAYVASLSKGSRRTQIQALCTVVCFFDRTATVCGFGWSKLTKEHVLAFRAWSVANFARSTTNRQLAALRGVLRAARDREEDPREVRRLVVALRVPDVRGQTVLAGRQLGREELARLFGAASSPRDLALAALVYACGLRRAELAALDREDLTDRGILVRGKGNVERIVPIPPTAAPFLGPWLQERGGAPGPLFVADGRRMHVNSVYKRIKRMAQQAGIADLSPHDLRRSYVSDLLDAGVDLSTVQQLVGHASPVTSARYDRRPERARACAVARLDVPPPVAPRALPPPPPSSRARAKSR